MAKQSVECLVEGGKASAGPPIGSSLGPLGVNVGQVVSEINKKTASFKGMSVPVKIEVDTGDKSFTISVGTPPTSQLVLKEARIEKGAGNPLTDKIADLRIEQIIKIAKMKEDALLGKTLKEKVKEVIGTCNSMGVMVGKVPAKEAIQLVNEGRFDREIAEEKTELSAEELKELEEEKKRLKEEIEKRKEELTKAAKDIIASMEGKERSAIKTKLREAKIPDKIIDELLPAETGVGGEGAKAAQPASPDAKKKA